MKHLGNSVKRFASILLPLNVHYYRKNLNFLTLFPILKFDLFRVLFVFVLTRDAFHSLSRVLRNATSHTAILTQTEQSATQQLERMAKEACCRRNGACYPSGTCFQDWSGITYQQRRVRDFRNRPCPPPEDTILAVQTQLSRPRVVRPNV